MEIKLTTYGGRAWRSARRDSEGDSSRVSEEAVAAGVVALGWAGLNSIASCSSIVPNSETLSFTLD